MKYALVTGGSRGIGREICLRLANMGYHVIINYQSNDEEANKTLKTITENGGSGQLMKFDVSDTDSVELVLGKWIDANLDKTIEVLVNNAGIRKDGLLMWMEAKDWNSVLRTNLDSFFNVTRLLVKYMMVNKFGRIINIVSLSGIKGFARTGKLFCCKSWSNWCDQSTSSGSWKKRCNSKCCCSGIHKNGYDQ
jgi:3-oxoacyl-[acyl-carrier protein] reductase